MTAKYVLASLKMWLIPSVIIIFVSANHRTWHIQCADAVISGIFRIDSQNSIDICFYLTPEPQVEQSAFFVPCVQIVFGHVPPSTRIYAGFFYIHYAGCHPALTSSLASEYYSDTALPPFFFVLQAFSKRRSKGFVIFVR